MESITLHSAVGACVPHVPSCVLVLLAELRNVHPPAMASCSYSKRFFHVNAQMQSDEKHFSSCMNSFTCGEKDFKTGAAFPKLWCGLKLWTAVSRLLLSFSWGKNGSVLCHVQKCFGNLLLEPTNFG